MTGSIDAWAIAGKLLALAALAAAISAGLMVLLRPLLARYAMARPNARSSHLEPTPQGGGIAVIAAAVVVAAAAAVFMPALVSDHRQLTILFIAAVGLAIVGVTDDIRPLEAMPRLALQAAAVALVIYAVPAELRVIGVLPWWLERLLILLGGVWLVNLVNFMDGIDWMTVAEVTPITAALAAFGLIGALPPDATLVAAGLCGAMLGFAPFNRPVARVFLGDVGSLPIGLLLGWLLLVLAGNGHLAAAALLPLYYLADATVTLLWRLFKGHSIMQAHRSHFYQQAVDAGRPVPQVIAGVFLLNLALAALALAAILVPSRAFHIVLVAIGLVLVTLLLRSFAKGKKPT